MTPNSLLRGIDFCFLLCTIITSLLEELQRHTAFVSFQRWQSLHIQLSYCWSTEAVIDCTRPKATLLLNWHKCLNIKKELCKWEFLWVSKSPPKQPHHVTLELFLLLFFLPYDLKNQQKLMEKPSKPSSTTRLGEKVHLQGLHCTKLVRRKRLTAENVWVWSSVCTYLHR